MNLTRRDMTGLLFTSLAMALWRRNAVAAPSVKAQLDAWVKDIDTMTRNLVDRHIKPIDSQLRLESLLSLVDLDDLMTYVDFSRLTRDLKLPSLGETDVVIDLDYMARVP